jgi:hypothetical protein
MAPRRRRGRARLGVATALAVILSVCAFGSTAIAGQPFAIGGIDGLTIPHGPQGMVAYGVEPPDSPVTAKPVTVPVWLSPFEYGGQGYQALMVGTDPAQGSATTVVPTVIVPLRMVFARDGSVLDAPGMAQELASSPLFTSFPYVVGTTQYTDAYRRADFWSDVATTSPDYHTLLGAPTILPTRTLTVPAALGHTFFSPQANRSFGYVDGQWFSLQVKGLIMSLQVDPRALVIFLALNTNGTIFGTSSDLCPGPACQAFGGYHGAFITGNPRVAGQAAPQSINTYIYAGFLDLGDLVPSFLNVHLQPVSHELLEWLDNPLIFSASPNQFALSSGSLAFGFAPTWTSPYYLFGCANIYEVADPLEVGAPSVGVPDAGHIDLFADAVFQSWFARTSPSTALGGLYDLIGVFQGFSDSCTL